jgi:proline iminopeptidase
VQRTLAAGIHELSVDGVRQVYRVAGRGPVCIAHSGGPGLDSSYLRSPELEEHFTVVYPEPVGTSSSGRLANYSLKIYVHFLAALIDHLDQPEVYLLGHSQGGFVALTYALEHPGRLAGLVLYSTSPEAGPQFWEAAMAGVAAYPDPEVGAAFQRALAAPDDDTISAEFAAALPVYFASWREEFAPFRAAIRMSKEPATTPDPAPYDVRDRLGELSVPTVIIVGVRDFICGPRWGEMLTQGIAGSQTVILPGSGHFAHVEQPAEFAAAAAQIVAGRS